MEEENGYHIVQIFELTYRNDCDDYTWNNIVFIRMISNIRQKINSLLYRFSSRKQPDKVPVRKQEFSIGIYKGSSPLALEPIHGIHYPVLSQTDVTDVPARDVADPFMIHVNNTWYMFFEIRNQNNGLGEIGLAISADCLHWEYQRIVLAGPVHMSYPYVFEWENEYYMVPEAWKSGGAKLYKADAFPYQWTCIGTLIEGSRIADSSIFRHKDMWWILADTGKDYKSPVLSLFYSEDLMGTWIQHPLSPIVDNNPHIARPGGRVVSLGDSLVRFAQDVIPVYGSQVYAFEIQELSTTTYREKQIQDGPILSSGNSEWNSGGMHHIDAHQLDNGTWLACVDGFLWREQEIK
ncbi:MAG: hypothetical protein HZC49_12100 [Nitrospirae bacterium]|nr:hypothetical protein [Nitrospirota bacterium]